MIDSTRLSVFARAEALFSDRAFRRGGVAARGTAEVLGSPVPDMAVVGSGDQAEVAVVLPVYGGHVDSVPPELQGVPVRVEHEDFRFPEHRLRLRAHVLGEEDVAAPVGASVLGAYADEKIEEAIAIPVDEVELRPAASVAARGGVDTVRLDGGAVLVAEFFAGEECGEVVTARAPV